MDQRKNESTMYIPLIEAIFFKYYREGDTEVIFTREDISQLATQLGIPLPKNLGDLVYSFRYRRELPLSISSKAPEGQSWVILSHGRSKYRFVLMATPKIIPSQNLVQIKIPDATPGVISRYALNDEQALLAILRYNRLIDIFTGLACYSLQNHLRTTVAGVQVETDEIYIGVDKRGAHYVIPVQAKGGSDKLGIVQIEQDIAMCGEKFPGLICRPVASQFMADHSIALFEFALTAEGVKVAEEKHYRLVSPDSLTREELESYQHRSGG